MTAPIIVINVHGCLNCVPQMTILRWSVFHSLRLT